MRIAIISDIHGNLEALKKVIEDIEKQNIDEVICIGDIIGKGIHPHECIEIVRAHCKTILMGNVDHRYSSNPEDYAYDPDEYKKITFNESLLTKEDMEFLQALPYSTEFYLSGNLVRLFHSDPNDVYNLTYNYDVKLASQLALFAPGKYTVSNKTADVVIFGHIHYQFLEKLFNRTLINSGSVGSSSCAIFDEKLNSEPREITQAHYLIIEGEKDAAETTDLGITFRSVSYNKEKELEGGEFNPEYEMYVPEILQGKYRGIHLATERFKKQGWNYDTNTEN